MVEDKQGDWVGSARPTGRARIETYSYLANAANPNRSARPTGRARIETLSVSRRFVNEG